MLGEVLFPRFCCHCHQLGEYLCADCYERLHFYPTPIPLSTLPIEHVFLDGVISAVEYESVIGSVIHFMKYLHAAEIADFCGELLSYTTIIPHCDFVTFVPVQKNRQLERGYNQSERMAARVAKHENIPLLSTLKKEKVTTAQAKMRSREERLKNQMNNFEVIVNEEVLLNKRILLIDDVCTTGTTLNECARVLKECGANTVIALTVAHGA